MKFPSSECVLHVVLYHVISISVTCMYYQYLVLKKNLCDLNHRGVVFFITLTADGRQRARLPIPPITTLQFCLSVVTEDLTISSRFSLTIFTAMHVQRSYISSTNGND